MTYAVVHREWVWKQIWSSILVLERSRRSGWHTSWKHTVLSCIFVLTLIRLTLLQHLLFPISLFAAVMLHVTKSLHILTYCTYGGMVRWHPFFEPHFFENEGKVYYNSPPWNHCKTTTTTKYSNAKDEMTNSFWYCLHLQIGLFTRY